MGGEISSLFSTLVKIRKTISKVLVTMLVMESRHHREDEEEDSY